MKNAFYFTSKALFLLKIFKFCLDFLVLWQNGLIGKIRLIAEFITSQPGKQTVVIHVVSNILRNKDNQVMRFGQLKEYNMKNIFLEKLYTKDGEETSPRAISGSTVWISIQLLDNYHNLLKLSRWPVPFTFYKGFKKKQKEVWN